MSFRNNLGWTYGRTDGHDLLPRCVVASKIPLDLALTSVYFSSRFPRSVSFRFISSSILPAHFLMLPALFFAVCLSDFVFVSLSDFLLVCLSVSFSPYDTELVLVEKRSQYTYKLIYLSVLQVKYFSVSILALTYVNNHTNRFHGHQRSKSMVSKGENKQN